MKDKKWVVLVFIVLILITYLWISSPKNDLEKLERLITKHINAKQTVEIFNKTVVDNHQLVSYIVKESNEYKQVGYAHILYNDNNKYEVLNIIEPNKTIEKSDDINLYEFTNLKPEFSSLELDKFTINTSIFIISNNPELAKIERIISNGDIQVKAINSNPSISFFDVTEEEEMEYKFYNKDGNII